MNVSAYMHLRRWAACALTVLLLVSCSMQAEKTAKVIKQDDRQDVIDQYKNCLANVRQSSRFDTLRQHIPDNVLDASLEQMTDDSMPTKNEIHAVYVTHPMVQACKKTAADDMITTSPALVSIWIDEWQKRDELEVQLVKQRISWGTFIEKSREAANASSKQLSAAIKLMDNPPEEDEKQTVSDAEQKQRAEATAMRYFQNQQIINDMN